MMKPLLIPLTYFCLQTWLGIPQAQRHENLNMVPNAFDDQYIGCAKEMDEIACRLLVQEISNHSLFRTVWGDSELKWQHVKKLIPLPPDFTEEHGRAIVAYTNNISRYKGKTFSTIFNDAVSENGTSRADYMAHFQFKAFHYYLTRALQLLRGRCDVMHKMTVYRGVPDRFQHSGDNIRFGHFASSSINKSVAERFMTKNGREGSTLFTIHTCFGVKIWNFSYRPPDKEVLIPVHEKFSVAERKGNNFTLWSTNRTCSYFNCAYLGGKKQQKCVDNSATRGGIAFPGVLSSSVFGGSVILVHVAALKLFAGF